MHAPAIHILIMSKSEQQYTFYYWQHCVQCKATVFELFIGQGATSFTDWVKLGVEKWTVGSLFQAKFHPHQLLVGDTGPKN